MELLTRGGYPLVTKQGGAMAQREQDDEHLPIEQQNDLMVQALRDMYEIYMRFDHPHPDEFGMIALKTLRKIGRLKD